MRKLVYVPLYHPSQVKFISKDSFKEIVQNHLSEFSTKPDEYYSMLKEDFLNLNLKKARAYLDGYPFNARQEKFDLEPDEYAPEMRILNDLLERGAILEHTENVELMHQQNANFEALQEVYGKLAEELHIMDEEDSGDEGIRASDLDLTEKMVQLYEEIDNLVESRDSYVARQIAKTLQEDETGILIMGVYHDVISKLPDDIQTEPLSERLVEIAREFKKKFPHGTEAISNYIGELEGRELKG